MLALLKNTIDKINTLKIFFDEETEAIEDKSVEGMRSNISEFFVNAYLQALMSDDESTFAQPIFKATEEIAEMHIEDIQIINGDDGKKFVTFKKKEGSTLKDIQRCSRYFRMFSHMNQIHYENAIVMLITKFEEFIANYFESLFSIFPNVYLEKEQIGYTEINGLTSEQIKEKIIENKVEAFLRQSYKDWFKTLENHKIIIPPDIEKRLIELYARRNIIVHNSGIVNIHYLNNVKNSAYKIGDSALMNEEYVENAFVTIKQAIFAILIESIKIVSDEKEEYINDIFLESFIEMEKGNYNVAITAFKMLSDNKCVDTKTKTLSIFNYWIAKKQLSGLDSIISEVTGFDVSIMEKIFVMAKNILLEDYVSAEKYINDLFNSNELSSNEIENWPLFINYRDTEYYLRFKESHKDDFELSTIEQDDINNDIPSEITDTNILNIDEL